MWGCAHHDTAEGIHRPLTVTVIACRAAAADPPQVLIGLDLGWWRNPGDEWALRGSVLEALSLPESHVIMQTAHTHAGPATWRDATDRPGGDKVAAYLDHVSGMVVAAAREAVETAAAATLSWTVGRCNLAAHRDLPHPQRNTILCGYHPEGPADDTVLVGRITTDDPHLLATIVNYACHPTSLGGDNRLISPDYVGALREVVEGATGRAPCLFLQGASGELGPRCGFSGDVSVADQNGRQLGYAVLSALESMLPSGQALAFFGELPSGAPLGIWQLEPEVAATEVRADLSAVELDLKEELADAEQLAERLAACEDRVQRERLERAYQRRLHVARDAAGVKLPIWGWRWGDSILIGTPAEAYSLLQTELRRQFPHRAVIVMNMVNGYASYLAPAELHGSGAYQVDVSLFGPGSLEQTVSRCVELARQLDQDVSSEGESG